MEISNRWFISSECWLLSNIPSMELCGVKCGMFINCEKYCLSLVHSLVFKQEWNKWSRVSSSSLQFEQRGESTFLNLLSIIFRYRTLFNNLKVCDSIITSWLYSHFKHKKGHYYLSFLQNNIFFSIPTLNKTLKLVVSRRLME